MNQRGRIQSLIAEMRGRLDEIEALVRILTATTALKGGPGRVTANPLVTTRRLHQRCRCVAAEATVLAWNG